MTDQPTPEQARVLDIAVERMIQAQVRTMDIVYGLLETDNTRWLGSKRVTDLLAKYRQEDNQP